MSTDKEVKPEQREEQQPADQGIERFARYTSPAMLAVLASAGQGSPAYAGS